MVLSPKPSLFSAALFIAIILAFCFSAHSLLACLPLSAAAARAFRAASSFSRFSFSLDSFSILSRLKISRPFAFCATTSCAVTVLLTEELDGIRGLSAAFTVVELDRLSAERLCDAPWTDDLDTIIDEGRGFEVTVVAGRLTIMEDGRALDSAAFLGVDPLSVGAVILDPIMLERFESVPAGLTEVTIEVVRLWAFGDDTDRSPVRTTPSLALLAAVCFTVGAAALERTTRAFGSFFSASS